MNASSPPRSGYFLPEHARYQLANLLEHLELLSQFIASRNADESIVPGASARISTTST